MKKIISFTIALTLLLGMFNVTFAAGNIDLGAGWSMRIDNPHTGLDSGQYHVHVYQGKNEVGSEGVNGNPSHKDNMNKVPNAVKKKVKAHSKYKDAQKKQGELEKTGKKNADNASKSWTKKNQDSIQKAYDAGASTAIIAGIVILLTWMAKIIMSWGWLFLL